MSKTKSLLDVKNLVLGGLFLALCLLLPFLTGQIPQIGSMLLPMHFPVLLCGYVCGWPMGLVVGALAPLLRSLIFGMPPMVPTALVMAFELAAYGVAAGLLYRLMPKKPGYVYLSLVLAMLAGRVVWGVASAAVYAVLGTPFTIELFLAGGFVKAVPGIIAQLLLIPPIVLALQKAGVIANK